LFTILIFIIIYRNRIISEEKMLTTGMNRHRSNKTLADKIEKSKNEQMGGLLKEQIACMKKMLMIVQNEKQLPVVK